MRTRLPIPYKVTVHLLLDADGEDVNIAHLVLEDGTRLQGMAFGAETDAVFELVFNTSMTGYQEILTDPSYRGQGVLFTVAHIGNVGINSEDYESAGTQVSAIVVRSISPIVSNWRASQSLPAYLTANGVPGISGVDTRWLTRKLRDAGTQKAALSTCGTSLERLLEMARAWPGLDGRDMVKEATCSEPYPWSGDAGDKWVHSSRIARQSRIVAYDFGIKRNILRHLSSFGAQVIVVPADTPAQEVLVMQPDGIFLSNGPGDPAGLPYAVEAVAALIESGLPILGVCLGHQLIGRALGGETRRLKFGHYGGNHPVQHLASGKVQFILNTPLGMHAHSDGAEIRVAAIAMNVPLLTTLSAAAAAVSAIRALRQNELRYRSLKKTL